ncbi:redoxin domain-containing protein [Paenibacillus konkukensis]|uniref:redoxin domain-containing protein n=1 Tax=Paenibacillus konkukensis TaxID=2020716 RepID=UPI00201DF0E2|nr:redoxin domain-containing protein [Paenibacillus konkukensis]
MWTLGPLVLSSQIVIAASAAVAGYITLRARLRRLLPPEARYDRAWDAALLWLVLWKLSALLFQPISLLENPADLLYSSGGMRGIWLATFITLGYVWFRDHKSPNRTIYIDSWLVSILVGYTLYRILAVLFLEGNASTNAVISVLGIVLLAAWRKVRPQAGSRGVSTLFVSFVILHALISTVAANTWEKSGGFGVQAAEDAAEGLGIGQRAPDFELFTLEGQAVKLSDFRGKKVLLNFWATWCPPCRIEMPVMQKFYSEYKDRDVVILSVDARHTEVSQAPVEAFKSHWGLTFPLVLDVEGQVGKTYQISAYPATYVLDEQGIIRKKHQGAMDEDMLKKAVR